jgi:hypothetical protein
LSAFEFFFSFYGLLLGLSVAALVGGFAGVLHERHRVRFGWLTPMLATFVVLDVATFWTTAWVLYRPAPYNHALLILGLAVATTFYIAASATFPRLTAEGVENRIDLDEHFWAQRRLVLACVLIANLINGGLTAWLIVTSEGYAPLGSSPRFLIGMTVFILSTSLAAFAPWRRVAVGALIVVLAYTVFAVAESAVRLFSQGGWLPAVGG